ncbi:hypothetical protein K501DRAFT_330427 [Backusella circina FSU 941]|nr:hypothetical protein K501DRAFT_330427 [Backusella circina FSU 941]
MYSLADQIKPEIKLPDKKDIPNYVIPLALVQAEIFWIYSALYCIFSNSRLYKDKKLNKVRLRSNSAPASTQSFTSLCVQLPTLSPSSSSASAKVKLETIDEEINTSECSTKKLRCSSLPEVCIRQRPSITDELNGTTCPPVWWQKTRVMFGYTPMHDNHSTKYENKSLQDTITTTMSSASSIISSANPLVYYDLQSVVTLKSTEQHIENKELCRHNTLSSSSNDDSDSSSSTKKKTKFVSKIRAVFHHKRNKN